MLSSQMISLVEITYARRAPAAHKDTTPLRDGKKAYYAYHFLFLKCFNTVGRDPITGLGSVNFTSFLGFYGGKHRCILLSIICT